MRFALILAIALATLMVTFSLQNAQAVQVHVLGWYFEAALVLVLLMSFTAGVLTMYLALLPRRISRSRELAELRRRLDECHRHMATPADKIDGE